MSREKIEMTTMSQSDDTSDAVWQTGKLTSVAKRMLYFKFPGSRATAWGLQQESVTMSD